MPDSNNMPNSHIDFGIDLLPSADLTFNLGNASQQWKIFGTLTGSATSWTSAQTVYVDLGDASKLKTINGGQSSAQIIGVDGVLNIANGGTGASSFSPNQVIISNSSNGTVTALASRAYLHRSSPTALSDSDNFVTEKTVYLGLPIINNNHTYKSNDTLFAPVTGGTADQILISKGSTSAPDWTGNTATLTPLDGSGYTLLTLGNATAQGKIRLYSSGTKYTDILSQAGSNNNTFYLPNYNGNMYATYIEINNNTVGSAKKPVYVDTGGHITASNGTVGNPYIPTYLNEGTITQVYPIQYNTFTISNGHNSATLDHAAYNIYGEVNNIEVIVLAIVVTEGESYLTSPITATTGQKPNDNTCGRITLSTATTVSGNVQGYILTARGQDLSNSN